MYMGERFDASPMATPPRMRHVMKRAKDGASALPMDVAPNRKAERMSNRLRPKRSLKTPATRAPMRHPTSAQLFAQPDSVALSVIAKYRSKNGFAAPTS